MSVKDTVSWREVKIDNKCWQHNDRYLGRCTDMRMVGSPHDPDPAFTFEATGTEIFQGLDLKFTKVNCHDRKSVLVAHDMLKDAKTPAGNVLGVEHRAMEVALYMDPLDYSKPPTRTSAAPHHQQAPPPASLPQALGPTLDLQPNTQLYPKDSSTFTPIVLKNLAGEKIYKCPLCNSVTGTLVPQNPKEYARYFQHNIDCQNRQKTPIEQPTGGRKYKKNSIKRKRHSKKNKYTKSKKLKTSKKHYKK